MQFTVDTRNATAFELTALAEFTAKLAGVAPVQTGGVTVFRGTEVNPQNLPKNDSPDNNSGNDAPTVIPEAPASATGSESPPPVPAAPSGTPATGASVVPAVPNDTKLDSAGFPWDARINTANKGTIGDGTWRKKPGVDPVLVESVRAELSAGKAAVIDAPAVPNVPAVTGVSTDAPNLPADAPVVPTLSAADVLARCTQIQMTDMSKGAQLFQAIVGAGVAGGPMALSGVTDPAVLAACLAAVNAVGAA